MSDYVRFLDEGIDELCREIRLAQVALDALLQDGIRHWSIGRGGWIEITNKMIESHRQQINFSQRSLSLLLEDRERALLGG